MALEDEVKATKKAEKKVKKAEIVFKNIKGEDASQKDYFFSVDGEDNAPAYFNTVCGYPVDREDMLEVFVKIFKPAEDFLFYKVRDKEVYVIIVPLKHSGTVGGFNESIPGDFQKHSISFISEGGVNLDTLRMKLQQVFNTIKVSD